MSIARRARLYGMTVEEFKDMAAARLVADYIAPYDYPHLQLECQVLGFDMPAPDTPEALDIMSRVEVKIQHISEILECQGITWRGYAQCP